MIDESVKKTLNEAVAKLNKQKEPKPQPLNGNYRNDLWYNNLFKTMNFDEAYEAVVLNLKCPSFSHEAECALRTYENVYGVPFQSKMERERSAIEKENEELKRKVAELESTKVLVDKEDGKTIDPEAFPKGMDREQHKAFYTEWFEKSQGVKPNGGQLMGAWKKYCKDNEIPA